MPAELAPVEVAQLGTSLVLYQSDDDGEVVVGLLVPAHFPQQQGPAVEQLDIQAVLLEQVVVHLEGHLVLLTDFVQLAQYLALILVCTVEAA